MKNSLATTLIACTLMSASVYLYSHTPGTYFTQQEWNEWVSAPKQENDILLLKDGTSLQGTVTTLPTASINGNNIQFRPDQLSLISTATQKNASKIQWMTTSGYSYITALPNDSITLQGSDSGSYSKIPLNMIESIILHNPSKSSERSLSTIELANGDSFPFSIVNKSVQSGRGTLYTNEFYDVSFDEGLHGTLKTDGKYKFIPHTSITESSFNGKIPYIDNAVVLNWIDIGRIQSDANGFIDNRRLVCHDAACEELTPGLYSLNYVEPEDADEDVKHWAALDPILAGAFVVSPDAFRQLSSKEQAARQLAETRELFEKIYISQLYEELQLMNDYDELVTALTHQENKKIAQEHAAQLQHDHDYNEIMVAFSYNHDYDRMVEHLSYKQFLSDYDELMDAMAMQDVDPKTFEIRFSDTTVEEDSPVESEKIEFAKLNGDQQASLQEQMEHGELAEVSKILGHAADSNSDAQGAAR